MHVSLSVLIVESEESITQALSRTLARRGHCVATVPSAERALALPLPDVFVCESKLPGACGFDLLSAVQERGDGARVVLLLDDPTGEECIRALRLGASELLIRPFRLADLVRAVEGRRPPSATRPAEPSRAPAEPSRAIDHRYPSAPASVAWCSRTLAAFTLRHGVPPSTRARIAGAAGEIVDNAIRHGRLPIHGSIWVRAEIGARSLRVRIRDAGVGFDPVLTRAAARPGPALTGLARAMALSESMRVRTTPGAGTEVDLRFSVMGASLSDRSLDLSEADFLSPGEVRGLLETLLEGKTPDVEGISPAVAVVLGRLLAGPEAEPCTSEKTSPDSRLP
jgi:anti-sigma regulatory factor (Ser/Thr protein kinase)/ActR/RegA family two-component response regulator